MATQPYVVIRLVPIHRSMGPLLRLIWMAYNSSSSTLIPALRSATMPIPRRWSSLKTRPGQALMAPSSQY